MKEMNGYQPDASIACIIICVGLCLIDGLAPMDFFGVAVGYEWLEKYKLNSKRREAKEWTKLNQMVMDGWFA